MKKILAARDRRIGVCLDVGWVTAAGFDAAEVFRGYGADRVFDIHFKDKTTETDAKGKQAPVDTELGKGKVFYFVAIDGCRFRAPVGPGDQVHFTVRYLSDKRGIWKFAGVGEVDGKVVVEAELMCAAREEAH